MAAIETGYRIGRILVMREVLRQAPAGFSAATKCFCTEHEWRVAQFVARVFGPEATLWNDVTKGLVYAPGYTIMGGTSNVMRNIRVERASRFARRAAAGMGTRTPASRLSRCFGHRRGRTPKRVREITSSTSTCPHAAWTGTQGT